MEFLLINTEYLIHPISTMFGEINNTDNHLIFFLRLKDRIVPKMQYSISEKKGLGISLDFLVSKRV
ncbi:hypothetical protein AF332_27665 [Sporosarcina globispora]|uniref:Uncharacterized protein n=1 Tax=Sporosarcina globispora TaxID=1459 RepID=A0A0M0G182_SPOGL|nr:hypothetical protein AF332_27665 [Sporosarcina globispora]